MPRCFALLLLLLASTAAYAADSNRFDALHQQAPELRAEILKRALFAFDRASSQGRAHRDRLTVIDYDLPSTEKRLWTFDLKTRKLLFFELVAHGRGSGENRALKFSNDPGSLASSVGTYVTANTYQGKHGLSLVLDGLESGFNDKAKERAVVIHGADYAEATFAKQQGRLGRSWGCPAVRPEIVAALIDATKDGSVVFIHANEPNWLKRSEYLPSGK